MAAVTKSVSGNVTTFAVTDMSGAIATLAMTTGIVTGPTVQFSGAAVRGDAVAAIATLVLQMETGIVPQVNGQ